MILNALESVLKSVPPSHSQLGLNNFVLIKTCLDSILKSARDLIIFIFIHSSNTWIKNKFNQNEYFKPLFVLKVYIVKRTVF